MLSYEIITQTKQSTHNNMRSTTLHNNSTQSNSVTRRVTIEVNISASNQKRDLKQALTKRAFVQSSPEDHNDTTSRTPHHPTRTPDSTTTMRHVGTKLIEFNSLPPQRRKVTPKRTSKQKYSSSASRSSTSTSAWTNVAKPVHISKIRLEDVIKMGATPPDVVVQLSGGSSKPLLTTPREQKRNVHKRRNGGTAEMKA
jgi:cell wall-associated NlpC family hydrolase